MSTNVPAAGFKLIPFGRAELDREQHAIMENLERGLGLMGKWYDEEDWYGGQIQQIARLAKGENGAYQIQLEPMEKRRSYRFARYLGSRRMLQLKIPDDWVMRLNELFPET